MQCEFSLDHYVECINHAKDLGYSFIPISSLHRSQKEERFIIMRHDVDFSLQHAMELALIEKDCKIKSTYFILLHSEFYNALSIANISIIKELSKIHDVCLHVDSRVHDQAEYNILESITGKSITYYSQHIPTMSPQFEEKKTEYNIHNLKNLGIKYISDSCRNWREGCMCNHIGKYDKLQILIHPCWWTCTGDSREQTLYDLETDQHWDISEEYKNYRIMAKTYLDELKIKQ